VRPARPCAGPARSAGPSARDASEYGRGRLRAGGPRCWAEPEGKREVSPSDSFCFSFSKNVNSVVICFFFKRIFVELQK
jgi:hypothetical protein